MTEEQDKIRFYVEEYKRVFREEYLNVVEALKQKRSKLFNKWGEIKGQEDDFVTRALGEMPETLYVLLQKQLTETEMSYLRSKKGAHWFYKKYSEFRLTESI